MRVVYFINNTCHWTSSYIHTGTTSMNINPPNKTWHVNAKMPSKQTMRRLSLCSRAEVAIRKMFCPTVRTKPKILVQTENRPIEGISDTHKNNTSISPPVSHCHLCWRRGVSLRALHWHTHFFFTPWYSLTSSLHSCTHDPQTYFLGTPNIKLK